MVLRVLASITVRFGPARVETSASFPSAVNLSRLAPPTSAARVWVTCLRKTLINNGYRPSCALATQISLPSGETSNPSEPLPTGTTVSFQSSPLLVPRGPGGGASSVVSSLDIDGCDELAWFLFGDEKLSSLHHGCHTLSIGAGSIEKGFNCKCGIHQGNDGRHVGGGCDSRPHGKIRVQSMGRSQLLGLRQDLRAGLKMVRFHHFYVFVHQLFVIFIASRELEGICQDCFALLNAGDDVGAAEPVGFGQVGLRPLRRVVGMRVVEADDVFSSFAAFALDPDELFGIDVVAVVRRIGTRVAGWGNRTYDARTIVLHLAEENAATLVRVGGFAVLAKGLVLVSFNFEHGESFD
jgi:hypothetical protein